MVLCDPGDGRGSYLARTELMRYSYSPFEKLIRLWGNCYHPCHSYLANMSVAGGPHSVRSLLAAAAMFVYLSPALVGRGRTN